MGVQRPAQWPGIQWRSPLVALAGAGHRRRDHCGRHRPTARAWWASALRGPEDGTAHDADRATGPHPCGARLRRARVGARSGGTTDRAGNGFGSARGPACQKGCARSGPGPHIGSSSLRRHLVVVRVTRGWGGDHHRGDRLGWTDSAGDLATGSAGRRDRVLGVHRDGLAHRAQHQRLRRRPARRSPRTPGPTWRLLHGPSCSRLRPPRLSW